MGNIVIWLLFVIPSGILRFTEFLNPFLYYHASSDIRDEANRLKTNVQKLFKCAKNSPAPVTAVEEATANRATTSTGVKIAWAETD